MAEWDHRKHIQTQEKIQAEFAPASTNQILGHVSWVDSNGPNAVVYLVNGQLRPTTTLVARNRQGDPTALLHPTSYHDDRALGVTLPYGKPSIGDEVILRAVATLPHNREKDNVTKTTITSSSFPFYIPEGTGPGAKKIIPEEKTPSQKRIMFESIPISEKK